MKTIFLDAHILATSDQTDLPASALTIGNFDGVHLGHQAMIDQLKSTATEQNLATMVMIFEPQPREYFAQLKDMPQSAPARLTAQHEKLRLLAQMGVDIAVVAAFDEAFRSLSAQEFADLLVDKLNVKALVLGDDFRFGHDRTGDSEFLRQYGLPVTNLHTITAKQAGLRLDTTFKGDDNDAQNTQRISSTSIRELLSLGELHTASQLLGRDYSITGEVIGGDKIGRTLDFPTANVALNRLRPAVHGVYGVDVVILDETQQVIKDGFKTLAEEDKQGLSGLRVHSIFGAASIGTRPSVNKAHDWRLEVFFPEFSGDLYGQTLEVRFLHHLHNERKYDGLAALKLGIEQDVSDLLEWRGQQLVNS